MSAPLSPTPTPSKPLFRLPSIPKVLTAFFSFSSFSCFTFSHFRDIAPFAYPSSFQTVEAAGYEQHELFISFSALFFFLPLYARAILSHVFATINPHPLLYSNRMISRQYDRSGRNYARIWRLWNADSERKKLARVMLRMVQHRESSGEPRHFNWSTNKTLQTRSSKIMSIYVSRSGGKLSRRKML